MAVLSNIKFLLFLFVAFTFMQGAALALTVTNLLDDGSMGTLRNAVMNTPDGGTVDFQAGLNGTIMLDMSLGEIVIDKNLTITGPGDDVITIDAQGNHRIFNVDDTDELTLRTVIITGLKFTGGYHPQAGGAIRNEEDLRVEDCEFFNNDAASGKAISNGTFFFEEQSASNNAEFILHPVLNIINTDFLSNGSGQGMTAGGAIFNGVGHLESVSGCFFLKNLAGLGGAIFNHELGLLGHIADTKFMDNAADDGGAIYIEGPEEMGGGLGNQAELVVVEPTISGSEFRINTADNNGGAIHNRGGLTIEDTDFIENEASFVGGAILNGNAQIGPGQEFLAEAEIPGLSITESLFKDNKSTNRAGALSNEGFVSLIEDTTFDGNMAFDEANQLNGEGGAIHNANIIDKINRTTFKNNKSGRGGAILNNTRINNILNATFHNNRATFRGGAIYNRFGDVQLSFVTMAFNTAEPEMNMEGGVGTDAVDSEGGGIYEDADTSVATRNSIIAFNTPDNCAGLQTDDLGGNYSDDTSCGYTGDDANIALGPLQNNGGKTETMELFASDPVDGAFDCQGVALSLPPDSMPFAFAVDEDQREFGRPVGPQCDAGAYERGAVPPVEIMINGTNNTSGNQLIKNRINKISISGITPGKKAALVYGFKLGNDVIGGNKCGGTPVDIRPFKIIAKLRANGSGNLNKTFYVPSTPETMAYIQVLDAATCATGEAQKFILLND